MFLLFLIMGLLERIEMEKKPQQTGRSPKGQQLILLCAAAHNVDGLDALSLGQGNEHAPQDRTRCGLKHVLVLGNLEIIQHPESCHRVHLQNMVPDVDINYTLPVRRPGVHLDHLKVTRLCLLLRAVKLLHPPQLGIVTTSSTRQIWNRNKYWLLSGRNLLPCVVKLSSQLKEP
jgi:hypothetical protein